MGKRPFYEATRLSESPGEIPPAEEMINSLVEDHEAFITDLRQDIASAMEEYDDQGTGDLLIEVLRAHEKMAWMLRSFIVENKG